MKIVGRKSEINELDRMFRFGTPEFVAVYGRRRVGKTFLVKEFFGNVMLVVVTAGGLVRNEYAVQDVQRDVTLEDLFAELLIEMWLLSTHYKHQR